MAEPRDADVRRLEADPDADDTGSELRNPFRSESDAFWLLGVIGGGAALVAVVAVLLGGMPALVVSVVLLALGTRSFVGWIRASIAAPDEPEPVSPELGD